MNRARSSASPVQVKIGFIASQKGVSARVGSGIRTSLEFVVSRRITQLLQHGIDLRILNENDWASPAEAVRAARRCRDDGAILLIGPSDSGSMKEVLLTADLDPIPKFATFATATDLTNETGNGFFRLTTNDLVRARKLVSKMREVESGLKEVWVYSVDAPEFSYAQGLRRDLVRVLTAENIEFVDELVSDTSDIAIPKDKLAPAIICGASADTVRIIGMLRNGGHKGRHYGFGSNTNYLKTECVGTIVVSDQDHYDSDPDIRRALFEFGEAYPAESEPSIATMNAAEALIDILLQRPARDWQDPVLARQTLLEILPRQSITGLFGSFRFSEAGEINGYEKICFLQVRKRGTEIYFDETRTKIDKSRALPLLDKVKSHPVVSHPMVKVCLWVGGVVAGVVGFAASVAQLWGGGG